LLLSLIGQRSIHYIHLAEDVLQSGISRPPRGQMGQARGSLTLKLANEVQIGIRRRPA